MESISILDYGVVKPKMQPNYFATGKEQDIFELAYKNKLSLLIKGPTAQVILGL